MLKLYNFIFISATLVCYFYIGLFRNNQYIVRNNQYIFIAQRFAMSFPIKYYFQTY